MIRVLLLSGAFLALPSVSEATLIVTFSNGDTFDGDGATDTAGPFLDAASGVSSTLTTVAVNPSGALNANAGSLGIADGGGSSFDNGESWTFQWDQSSEFEGIDFASFSTASESFSLTSTAFVGLGPLTPGDSNITFDNGLGRFTFGSGDTSDDFNLNDLSGGVLLPIAAGTPLTLAFSGAPSSDSATLTTMSFSFTAVPEPSTSLLLAGALSLFAGIHRRRRGRDGIFQ